MVSFNIKVWYYDNIIHHKNRVVHKKKVVLFEAKMPDPFSWELTEENTHIRIYVRDVMTKRTVLRLYKTFKVPQGHKIHVKQKRKWFS